MSNQINTDKKSKSTKTYSVTGWVTVLAGVDVPANNFEEALEKANRMKPADFVTIKGYFLDDKPVSLNGIYTGDPD